VTIRPIGLTGGADGDFGEDTDARPYARGVGYLGHSGAAGCMPATHTSGSRISAAEVRERPDQSVTDGHIDPELIERLAAVDREWAHGSFRREVEIMAEGGDTRPLNKIATHMIGARERECSGEDGILRTEGCNDYDRAAIEREVKRQLNR